MVIDGVVGRTAPRVLDFNKMLGPSKWRALTAALTGLVRQAGRTPSFKVNTPLVFSSFFFTVRNLPGVDVVVNVALMYILK